MLSDDDIYNIPSVPKFADLRRVGQGEPTNESNTTIGDGYFDVSGVIVGSVSSSVPNANNIIKCGKEESTNGSNKENESAQKMQEDSDESMFGLAKLAMFRPPKQHQRAASTEPALVRQSHENGHHLMKSRASSTDTSRQRSMMPPNNQGLKQRMPVRRSVPAVLHPIRHDRVRNPSGDARTQFVGKGSGLAVIRHAKPEMGTTRTADMQHRLQRADPAAYHGPQTGARAMLDKRVVTSTADWKVVEQRGSEKQRGVVGKTEQKQKAVVPISSIHRGTELEPAQVSERKKGAPKSGIGALKDQSQAIDADVVVKGESKSACVMGGGHVPRDRTRRNAPPQKGPVRLMRVSTASSKGLPSVGSERRFRESVTRRERGGDSLECKRNSDRHQTKQIIPEKLPNPNPPANLLLKEQKRVTGSTSGDQLKSPARRNENRPQTKVVGEMRRSDRMEALKTGHHGEKGPAQTFHRRPSSHLTEAEREALFKRLSTPRSVVAKNVACGTPKKPSVKSAAESDEKKRSRSPVPGHPATRGLYGHVRRPRSNPSSRNSSRPGSAIDSESVDQQGPSGVEHQPSKTKGEGLKPVDATGRNKASHMKLAGQKSSYGRGDMKGRAERGISSSDARKLR